MQIDFGEGGVAADGNGRNSPFTAALIRHMSARGLEIRQMIARVRRDVLAATGDQAGPVGQFLARRRRLSGGSPVDSAVAPAHASACGPFAPPAERRDPCANASLPIAVRRLMTCAP